jgi:hypothetical protein
MISIQARWWSIRIVDVGQAAELVVVVLEGVGVDGAELDTVLAGEAAQRGVVVDAVPRDVQGDRGSHAGESVHRGGVGDLLLHRARRAGRAEHLEPGAGVAERPRRQLDGEAVQQRVHRAITSVAVRRASGSVHAHAN